MKEPQFYRRFDYEKSLLPNDYLASLENGVTEIEEAKSRSGFSIGYPGWNLIYYLLMSHLDPQSDNFIIETGTNWGCTTVILAQALKDSSCKGEIITVELDSSNYKLSIDNFTRANVLDVITAIEGDSKQILREIMNTCRPIRFALLDASHLFADVIEEFEIIYPLLMPKSLVIFDNTYQIAEEHEDQRVYGALKEIKREFGGNLVNLEFVSWFTPGIAMWQKE